MSELACGHTDGFVCTNCSEGVKWFPRITVEKYSIDQTAFAEARLAEERSWGRRPLIARASRLLRREIRVPVLHGDFLRELFPNGPEDGFAYDAGNSMVNGGLNAIIYLLTQGTVGGVHSGSNGYGFTQVGSNGVGIIGVGCNTTAWAATQIALSADNTANAWYQQMDSTFPTLTTPNVLNGQVTVASGNGNFAWNEWCWATGSGTVTAGSQLSAVPAGQYNMYNRKVPASSLGTKASGASWVFTQTITFS